MNFVKVLVASALCVTFLVGFTSCMDEMGNLWKTENTQGEVTASIEDVTTTRTPENTTTKPNETTTPVVTPPGVTTPQIETTNKPVETTTPPIETTTPGDIVQVPEDLPADKDGYNYPEYFKNLVYETVRTKSLFPNNDYRQQLRSQKPEIVFVDLAEYSKEEPNNVVIFCKYNVDPAANFDIYTRMSFTTTGNDYAALKNASNYGSYAEYIAAVETSLKKKAVFDYADISTIYSSHDVVNNMIGEKFAKSLGENFVDASVHHARGYDSKDLGYYVVELNGFAYDAEGKSYSYVLKCQKNIGYIRGWEVVKFIEDGILTVDDFKLYDVYSKPVAGVFQSPETAE